MVHIDAIVLREVHLDDLLIFLLLFKSWCLHTARMYQRLNKFDFASISMWYESNHWVEHLSLFVVFQLGCYGIVNVVVYPIYLFDSPNQQKHFHYWALSSTIFPF